MIINYEIENRNALFAQLKSEGKEVVSDVTIGLDENGRLKECYCEVVDTPPAEPDETADLLEAAAIMGLEPEEG